MTLMFQSITHMRYLYILLCWVQAAKTTISAGVAEKESRTDH